MEALFSRSKYLPSFQTGKRASSSFVPSFNVPAAVRPSLRPAVNRSLTLLTVELPFLPCYATHSPLSHRAPPSLPGLLSTLYTGGKESPSLFLVVVVVRWWQAGGRSVGPLSDDGGGGFSHVLLSPSLSLFLLLLPPPPAVDVCRRRRACPSTAVCTRHTLHSLLRSLRAPAARSLNEGRFLPPPRLLLLTHSQKLGGGGEGTAVYLMWGGRVRRRLRRGDSKLSEVASFPLLAVHVQANSPL